jgi:hypothetical protein
MAMRRWCRVIWPPLDTRQLMQRLEVLRNLLLLEDFETVAAQSSSQWRAGSRNSHAENTQPLIHDGIKAEFGIGRFHNGTGLILNRCRHVGEHIVKPREPSNTVQSRLNRVLAPIKSNKVL